MVGSTAKITLIGDRSEQQAAPTQKMAMAFPQALSQ